VVLAVEVMAIQDLFQESVQETLLLLVLLKAIMVAQE